MKFKIKSISASQDSYSSRKGEPFRDYNKAYVWVSGEDVMNDLVNRHNRPYKYYQDNVLPQILKEVNEKYPDLNINTDAKSWGWRQKCGCSCPCSPGFIQKNAYGSVTISAEVEFISE
jgi:hypothetical protein